jgi:zinc transport system substrate-binding protein
MQWLVHISRLAALLILGPVLFTIALHAAPRVVATIKPVHSLAASILEGVTEPKLLLNGASSPHNYALKPSDMKALEDADAIIRVSEHLEVFLDKVVRALPQKARIIDLEKAPGLSLLPVRQGETGDHEGGGLKQNAYDVHFWLDPINAIAIARYLDLEFARIDPIHAAQYHANAQKLEARLLALDAELTGMLTGLSGRPFIVFHDVTQYLERRYGLSGLGALTLSPERPPGGARLEAVRTKVEQGKAVCVFSEPQFPPRLIAMLIAGTSARQGIVDEAGASIPAGPDQYFRLMQYDAESVAACLK